jgi:cell division protein FtsI/penicillin-binding protein 2
VLGQLTINLDYQKYAEQALETTLKARRTQLAPNPKVKKPNGQIEKMNPAFADEVPYKAPAASEIIMDYTTGDIIAMASYPTFDNAGSRSACRARKPEIFPTRTLTAPDRPRSVDPRQPPSGPLQPGFLVRRSLPSPPSTPGCVAVTTTTQGSHS